MATDLVPTIRPTPATSWNMEYIDALYREWKQDPASVNESWQMFFAGFELAMCPRTCVAAENARDQSRVASLIFAYRAQGHRIAQTDPLGGSPTSFAQLELEAFGLSDKDLERVFDTGHLGGPQRAPLRDIIAILRDTYCRSVGVEYLHIQDMPMRRWLQQEMEPRRNRPRFSRDQQREIVRLLVDAELFESFVGTRYPGQKRFSLEGAESLIPAIHTLVELAPDLGAEEIVLGMSHRGRLSVLANILDKSYEMIFSEFEENLVPSMIGGDGDVKYHKGYSSDHVNARGRSLHLSLTANPSHLEAVDPVVEGRARAKQRQRGDTARRRKVIPLLVHGDAAFAGQGLVAETLNLSRLDGYRTGGTVHIIVNNRIGFTTSPEEARSTPYPTDVAKMIQAPIFHVNGDDPEAVVWVAELALRYRQEFGEDVVIDLVCYRRHGHSEGDEPAFTQPVLYRKIKEQPAVRVLYTRRLVEAGQLSADDQAAIASGFKARLQRAFESVKAAASAMSTAPAAASAAAASTSAAAASSASTSTSTSTSTALSTAVVVAAAAAAAAAAAVADQRARPFLDRWQGLGAPYSDLVVATGVAAPLLEEVAAALCTIPGGFSLHPKVARQLPERLAAVRDGGAVDWATAESLAFGTLLREGVPVRLSGQDTARGTFSQRHAVWQDTTTQEHHVPLNHIHPDQAHLCVYNSMLSEAAVLGFDYGYSLDEPHMLIIWEAQFGDFANGAQVIIDQFIVCSEAKWKRTSGLVMLLPHGYEGQGPEHSNAYLERYLAACAENNIQVCNVSTPAQYFHVLRRQVKRPFRRPLILMATKSLLRHPLAVSPVAGLRDGHFSEILDDPRPPEEARRVVFCSGKLFYDLWEQRERVPEAQRRVALLRVEQLYPLCDWRMLQAVQRYARAEEVVWAQEEPQNRGGWTYMQGRLQTFFPDLTVSYVGRAASASPATGALRLHRREQEQLVQQAIGR